MGLAILISCLGLFGVASFVAEQRTKEIGVHKVLDTGVVNLCELSSLQSGPDESRQKSPLCPIGWFK
jgi:hypothetical protein